MTGVQTCALPIFAPAPGTHVLAPIRFLVVSMLANLVIEVDQFALQPPTAPPAADPRRE